MVYQLLFSAGALCSIVLMYKFIKFILPYFRPSKLSKYLNTGSYAVVTGSTDGIGKAIAMELASRGFNIILHGRNAKKAQEVIDEITHKFPEREIEVLLHDASKDSKMDISSLKKLPVSVIVNNAGTGPITEFGKMSEKEIEQTITLNTAFPTQLTRALLPQLQEPSLILNVSSYAGLLPPPYLAVYAGTKAYNNSFSIALSRELENTEVISLLTGSVNSGSNKKPVRFLRPSAATYAKHILNIVGCGRKSIMPYWPHAVQTFLISLLPERIIDRATKKALQKEMKLH